MELEKITFFPPNPLLVEGTMMIEVMTTMVSSSGGMWQSTSEGDKGMQRVKKRREILPPPLSMQQQWWRQRHQQEEDHPDHFSFRPVPHRFRKYVICIEVDCHHYVAVASLWCVGESARLISVDFLGEVHHANENVVEFGGWVWFKRWAFSLDLDPCLLLLN